MSDGDSVTETGIGAPTTGTTTLTLPEEMTADDVEREVTLLLGEVATAAELQGLCDGISLTVPTAIEGQTKGIYKHFFQGQFCGV